MSLPLRNRSRRLTPLCLASILAAVSAPAVAMTDAALDFCRLELVFADEFDEISVAPWHITTNTWIAHTPWAGDFGDAQFADPEPDFPFTINDGILEITARQGEDGIWRSGLLASADGDGNGFGQQYGYFESRIRMPTGPGTWPAFWLGTIDPPGWTEPTLEVDIIEYYGHAPDIFHTVYHEWFEGVSNGEGQMNYVPHGMLEEDFNIYSAMVTPEFITFYLNREPIWQVPTPESHKNRLLILVNLALGSGWPIDETPNPSVMLVDYVRAYALTAPQPDCEPGIPD